MEKENYYLLLELSLNPPEQDPKVITKAIKKKQAQWSRYRNHPTKAIQAKRYIGLIPEIRKVMQDADLRKNEARMAVAILKKRDREKFAKVDKHLSILMGKDGANEKVISKLAGLHKALGEDKVREHIAKHEKIVKLEREIEILLEKGDISDKQAGSLAKSFKIGADKVKGVADKKKTQKFAEIDKYLSIRIRRGFITQKAITGLAKLYSVGEDEINRRVKCPIRKEGGRRKDKPKPLDKTIEKLINDNLKIVKKTSLYGFLDIAPSASLENLQKRAKEKETEVRKMGKKGAITTASAVLAGHCIAIFKTDQTRSSYEWTRTLARISELESEIDVAELEGKIKPASLKQLIRTAVQIGMDPDEAYEYIEDYCKPRKWDIGMSPKKKRARMMMVAAIAGLVVLGIGVFFGVKTLKEWSIRKDFNELEAKTESPMDPKKKERLIEDFVKGRKKSDYTNRAESKLLEVRREILEADYKKACESAEKLTAENELDKALAVYNGFLRKHKANDLADDVGKRAKKLGDKIDRRDFSALSGIGDQDYDKRIELYYSYIEKHPKGMYVDQVGKMISEAIGTHFKLLQNEIGKCEKKEDWEECINLTSTYIEKYKNHERSDDLKKMRAKFENNLKNKRDLDNLKKKADEKGTDYEAAIQVYQDYLTGQPEVSSYMRNIIAGEVGVLDKKLKQFLREEKEWKNAVSYSRNESKSFSSRIAHLQKYMKTSGAKRHMEEAKPLLNDLKDAKATQDARLWAEKEEKQWRYILANYKNNKISISKRIETVRAFLGRFPNGPFSKDAVTVLAKLRHDKKIEDEAKRKKLEQKARINQETAKMRSMVRNTRGRFAENGNGTITDKQTGLIWSTVDSSIAIGKCMTHYQAVQYVQSLTTGGHRDWRLPRANDLHQIYKTSPYFPSPRLTRYWSSDIVQFGWNKQAYVVSTKKEKAWNKDQYDLDKCAHVRAVRR